MRNDPVPFDVSLHDDYVIDFENIVTKSASEETYSTSLEVLSAALEQAYGKSCIILIDEYDAAINASYIHGYYEDMINFMRAFLCSGLKDNNALEKSVLTGILRVAKEGIFSGINNLKVLSITRSTCADKFGFTQPEVDILLDKYTLSTKSDDAKIWYNGYNFGDVDNTPITIYNPWSILSFVKNNGRIHTYWSNTSDNALVKHIIAISRNSFKKDFEQLMAGETITQRIDDDVVLAGIEKDETAIWSLLLSSGYLTTIASTQHRLEWLYTLKIPNQELLSLFRKLISKALTAAVESEQINDFFELLISGQSIQVGNLLQKIILQTASVYDFAETEPERSYHLFILGMLVTLADDYHVRSNRESGYGRYDVMIIPSNPEKPGVVIEFKKIEHPEELEAAADAALTQIAKKNYAAELQAQGVTHIYSYGIAFKGKELLVKMVQS